MGNGNSHAREKSSEKQEELVVPNVSRVARNGAEGLHDLGFEYRFIPCNEHSARPRPCYTEDTVCFECSTPLFHIESDTSITTDNRKRFIPDGTVFDQVSTCCTEVAVEWLCRDLSLKFITLYGDVQPGGPVRALVNQEHESEHSARPTLLIITGKGKSRAGILTVKHLVETSFEVGSVLYPVTQAAARGWNVVLLDPNARGAYNGMDVTSKSLDHVALKGPLYVLAHSAAGGYLVRYMMDNNSLVNQISGLVFTDSTHNIQWTREDLCLNDFLQSSICLYIRNCAERPTDTFANHRDKKAGEVAEGDVHWCRRFGGIKTVWAGTIDHSFMCYAARHVIWDFFDSCRPSNGNAVKIVPKADR